MVVVHNREYGFYRRQLERQKKRSVLYADAGVTRKKYTDDIWGRRVEVAQRVSAVLQPVAQRAVVHQAHREVAVLQMGAAVTILASVAVGCPGEGHKGQAAVVADVLPFAAAAGAQQAVVRRGLELVAAFAERTGQALVEVAAALDPVLDPWGD